MANSSARTTKQRTGGRRRKDQWWQNWLLWVGIGAIVLVAIVFVYALLSRPGNVGTIDGLQSFPGQERGHTTELVVYTQSPPVGGKHNPAWQNCGIYDTTVANENAVHSLEHGAVWITYQPDLAADQVATLRNLVRGRGHALLSPYEGLPSPIVASAWGYQLQVADAGDARLGRFLTAYEQGPQTPEPGAACVGGVGTPVNG